MDRNQQLVIPILGDKKIPLAALAPTIYECTDGFAIIISRNNSLNGIKYCESDTRSNVPNVKYPIVYANPTEKSLESFLDTMRKNHIRVGVVNYQSPLFSEIIKNENSKVWLSACREGLYKTYLPILERGRDQTTHILVFDNDESIAIKARDLCKNPNILIHKCIIHSVCSALKYDYNEQVVRLTCGKECFMVFPPEISELENFFRELTSEGRSELAFTKTDNSFQFYKLWKPICINALHTLASVRAYTIGIRQGLDVEDISNQCFSNFISKENMLNYVLRVYSILYDKHLSPYEESLSKEDVIFENKKEKYAYIAEGFISGLFDQCEVIGRGLDPNHPSFVSKVKQHLPLLESSNDLETLEMLNNFKRTLKLDISEI